MRASDADPASKNTGESEQYGTTTQTSPEGAAHHSIDIAISESQTAVKASSRSEMRNASAANRRGVKRKLPQSTSATCAEECTSADRRRSVNRKLEMLAGSKVLQNLLKMGG